MRRLLILILVVLVCLPSVYARKTKAKSGEIENNVYIDSKYDFQLTLLENWKAKLQKPKDICRLILTQEEHAIPPALMQFPLLARTPNLEIYIADEELTPGALVDSLTSNSYKSDLKKQIMHEILILEENISFDKFIKTQKNLIEIDGKRAVQWAGSAESIKDLGMGETDPKSYGVAFIAVKNEKQVIVFALTCENMFLPEIFSEVYKIASSLKWGKGE
ncbi:MAG: hypothetical protein ABIJ45_06835 [Candidatus Zixiibacteriota bacterium]